MAHDDALMVAMFWAGLLVAFVPILVTGGILVFVFRRILEERRDEGQGRRNSPMEARGGAREPGSSWSPGDRWQVEERLEH